jgi:hypothetical protein
MVDSPKHNTLNSKSQEGKNKSINTHPYRCSPSDNQPMKNSIHIFVGPRGDPSSYFIQQSDNRITKNHTTSGASIAASSSILSEYSFSFAFETLNQQEFTN